MSVLQRKWLKFLSDTYMRIFFCSSRSFFSHLLTLLESVAIFEFIFSFDFTWTQISLFNSFQVVWCHFWWCRFDSVTLSIVGVGQNSLIFISASSPISKYVYIKTECAQNIYFFHFVSLLLLIIHCIKCKSRNGNIILYMKESRRLRQRNRMRYEHVMLLTVI